MAPLSRKSTRQRGSVVRGKAGAFVRGRASTASRGRGRGFHGRGRGINSTFYSTRVEEPLQDSYDETHSSEAEDLDEVEQISEAYSSDEDIDASSAITKPYNELLQSFHGDSSNGQPPRKRQKFSNNYTDAKRAAGQETSIGAIEADKPDVDYVEEPEEGGGVQTEAHDDGGSDDEPEAGVSMKSYSLPKCINTRSY